MEVFYDIMALNFLPIHYLSQHIGIFLKWSL